jgi:hypothetical protein
LKLIRDEDLRARISSNALADSASYSKEKFQSRLDELLKDIGVTI